MRLVFDIEGNGLLDTVTQIWCITAKDIDTGEIYQWTIESKESLTEFLSKYLTPATEIIGHNILSFDLPLLKSFTNWEPSHGTKISDTLVLSRLLNPDRRTPPGYTGKGQHSLGVWGYRVGRSKPEHEDWSKFSPEMLHRNREDVEINCMVYSLLQSEIGDWDWSEAIRIEHGIARIVGRQERHGILFNEQQAREYISDLTSRIESIDEEILPQLPKTLVKLFSGPVNEPFLKTGGYRKQTWTYLNEAYPETREFIIGGPFSRIKFEDFNVGSADKVKSYLLGNGWVPDAWNYSKRTGERTSPKLQGSFDGVDGTVPRRVKERIIWRHRRSQIEGWLGRLRPDGRLSAGANPCGTNTGRMRHHTVVNIPKANANKETGELIWDTEEQKDVYGTQMRSLFVVPEGYKLVGHDASGIELRMLAHYMNDEEFTKQILSGDIHEYNRNLAGLPDRDAAKTFIYALIYGAGDAKIGSIIGGTADDGAELKGRFFRAIPKLEKLINSVKRASGKGYLKGLDGRKVWMRRSDDGRIQRNRALNTLLQNAAAVVMKQSCITLWKEIDDNKSLQST